MAKVTIVLEDVEPGEAGNVRIEVNSDPEIDFKGGDLTPAQDLAASCVFEYLAARFRMNVQELGMKDGSKADPATIEELNCQLDELAKESSEDGAGI